MTPTLAMERPTSQPYHQDLLAEATQRLHQELSLAADSVHCLIEDGWLVLSGSVSSWYQKQMAQESVMRMDSGLRIDNRLSVV